VPRDLIANRTSVVSVMKDGDGGDRRHRRTEAASPCCRSQTAFHSWA